MERRLRVCAHCQESFTLASTGRPPKYCSSACRKKAWEDARFAQAVEEGVVVALAKAVAAEQRKSRQENRQNETLPMPDIRQNETPSQATPQIPERRPPSRRRAGMTGGAMPLLPFDADGD